MIAQVLKVNGQTEQPVTFNLLLGSPLLGSPVLDYGSLDS